MPLRSLLRLTVPGALALILLLPVTQASGSMPDTQRHELHGEIRAYLLEHPEIIAEAIEILRTRQAQQAENEQRTALQEHRADLLESGTDPVLGNPKGDVTIVSFSDYQCGYCKRMLEPLMDVLKKDRNVRIVFKELPVLGPMSTNAARTALAANMQGKYRAFYTAMMEHRGAVTEQTIRTAAKTAGLDMGRLDSDLKKKAVSTTLDKNMELAAALGIRGTPAFVIGDQVLPGAVDADTLVTAVKKARQAS